jgi:ABC-type phosphate transport system substrate-binding protein
MTIFQSTLSGMVKHLTSPLRGLAFLTFLCFTLSACSASTGNQTIQVSSSTYPLQVDITPALGTYRPLLNQCAQTQPGIALFVQETPVSNMAKKVSDLQLRLGLPNQGVDYAFQVGEEEIRFVVNSNQKIQTISAAQIRAIFAGGITDWGQASGNPGVIHPWVYPDENELGLIFDRIVMNGEHTSPSASVASDPESMLQAVAQDEGAIGFLPSSWLTDTIQPVGLEKNLASQLNFPVLATTKSEPQGLLGIYIACLQKNGKSIVESH